ncbi:hypothetical protein [Planomonospora sp. ID82291]|uniref:hypothetical protein n=1 Tax=Planomonospora sp. ID82291 TaxID=2738136 RepID=UPI0018C40E09|nr:hypothetical protein [Planomonospora sp. ID82291]MBG0813543.1 hypothetical protein [Planomonospora sp. ID82291]
MTGTQVHSSPEHVQPPPPAGGGRRVLHAMPAVVLGALTAGILVHSGVPGGDLLRFTGYLTVAVLVPGVLLWRAVRRGPGLLVTDLAAGLVLGTTAQILSYIPARAVGQPLLTPAWAVITLVVFAAVPGLRRHWRVTGPGPRAPIWWSWAMAALLGHLLLQVHLVHFTAHGLRWPGNANPYVDMPFHLAMAAELKHHMPPSTPYVAGEPLNYYWFVYADLAATGWGSGVELQTLLLRLSQPPQIAAAAVLIAVLAWRLSGKPWTGPLALLLPLVAAPVNPLGWASYAAAEGGNVKWLSPTYTLGAAVFSVLVLLLLDLLRRPGTGSPPVAAWTAAALLTVTVACSKLSFLVVLGGGLATVIAVGLLVDRRLHRPAALGLVLVGGTLLLVQAVVFRGEPQGLVIDPFATMRRLDVVRRTGLDRASGNGLLAGTALGAGVLLASLLAAKAPVAGLVRSRHLPRDPFAVFLAGMFACGLVSVLVFKHHGGGEWYILHSAYPHLWVLVAWGISALTATRSGAAVFLAALATGVVTLHLSRSLTAAGAMAPAAAGDVVEAAAKAVLPYAALGLVALLAVLPFRLLLRRSALGVSAWTVVSGVMAGYAIPLPVEYAGSAETASADRDAEAFDASEAIIPQGAVAAARRLRSMSSPDDIVATNVHCRRPDRARCDPRHFWISALTERRVLVEGWAYTTKDNAYRARSEGRPGPFWDAGRLAANDDLFRNPSASSADRLRTEHGVGWLFVDTRHGVPPGHLAAVAELRYRKGSCEVYELVGAGT